MKVLVWTQYFWPENFHINQVVAELHEQGAEVTVLTGKPNYPDGKIFPGYSALGVFVEQRDGVEIIRLPLCPRGKSSAKGLVFNYLSFIASGCLVGPWALRGRKFDVVFVYAPSPLLQALPAIVVSWLKRAPLVLWVQDIWPESLQATGFVTNRRVLKAVEHVVRLIYRFSDSILIQSEGFRDSVRRLSGSEKKIRFFPNSAEASSRSYDPVDKQLGRISEHFSVVFAGNIGVAQSCATIVEAARILQGYEEIRFFIVGSGSMEKAISGMIQDERLSNIELLGRVSPAEVSGIYAAASALLLTLRDDPILAATVPSKFQSYLAAGKPIIASCNGQTAQVLADAKAGLDCAAQDAQQLAEAVLELYGSDPERLERMGESGRAYFLSHFHLPARVSELIEHFDNVVQEHRG